MTDSTELYYAEMEAARSDAEKAYFEARPQHMWMPADHALFRAGFERAFQLLWKPASTCNHDLLLPNTTCEVDPNNPCRATCRECGHEWRTR
jgi:hypothetical protein